MKEDLGKTIWAPDKPIQEFRYTFLYHNLHGYNKELVDYLLDRVEVSEEKYRGLLLEVQERQ